MKAIPWCQLGDEYLLSKLLTITMTTPLLSHMYRQVTCEKTQLSHSESLYKGSTLKAVSLLLAPPLSSVTLLPLPYHWILLPLISQGEDDVTVSIIRECLTMLETLEITSSSSSSTTTTPPYISLLTPATKLYHVMNVGMFHGPVVQDPQIASLVRSLSNRYISSSSSSSSSSSGGGGGVGVVVEDEAHREKMETLVKDLLERVQQGHEGWGPTTYLLRLFLMPDVMPVSLRERVWSELGSVGLLHLLDEEGEGEGGGSSSSEAEEEMERLLRSESRSRSGLLDLYVKAVTGTHSIFGLERGGVVFVSAIMRLAEAIFGPWEEEEPLPPSSSLSSSGELSSSNRNRLVKVITLAPSRTVACLLMARKVGVSLRKREKTTRTAVMRAFTEAATDLCDGKETLHERERMVVREAMSTMRLEDLVVKFRDEQGWREEDDDKEWLTRL